MTTDVQAARGLVVAAPRLAASRRRAESTTNIAPAPIARQADRNSIGTRSLLVWSRMNGTMFCATKPPRLPTELIAAIPAAAVAPRRKVAGIDQNTGWAENVPA